MITPEKIEEWIKEVEERPSSASLIVRYIANRLRDLSDLNEELLAENISLRTRERAEEYERRIQYLEYQLELIKRQSDSELPSVEITTAPDEEVKAGSKTVSILVYDTLGHVLRLDADPESLGSGAVIAHLEMEEHHDGGPLRLLALPATEELLFVYTSGRVDTLAVVDIPPARSTGSGESLSWDQELMSEATLGGETLACLAPVSNMALCDYFVQVSRRGYVKKLSTTMAASILSNRYIGTGVKQAADQTFNLLLCSAGERICLVSRDGYLLCVEVNELPLSIEEAMRLGATDHLVGAFLSPAEHALLVMTNNGKAIHRTAEYLEGASGIKMKGKAIYSQRRREEGVRVVGAGAVRQQDWGTALHTDGRITMHALDELMGSGAVQTDDQLLAFCTFHIR